MKTLLKLAAAALLTWATTGTALAARPANLTISSERGQPFSLVLDGRLLTRPVAPQVRVSWLAPGRHWADISVPTAYGPPLRFRTSVWLEPGFETRYVLLLRPYGPQLRRIAVVAAGGPAYGPGGYPDRAYPGGAYPAQPNGYPPQPGGYGAQPPQSQPQGNYPDNGQNAPYGGQAGDPNAGSYEQPAPADGQGGAPGNSQYDNGNLGNPAPGNSYPAPDGGNYDSGVAAPAERLLSPTDAASLARALRQRRSDDERLRIARQALSQTSVQAQDLAELLKALSYDKSRVELAKFAYAHIADPQNFYRVYDAFQSEASARELQDAVEPQR